MHGFYAFPPNDCFRDLEADTPYLVRALEWGLADIVDENGKFVRYSEIHWVRPVGWEKPYVKLSGNVIWKGITCGSVSTNQG